MNKSSAPRRIGVLVVHGVGDQTCCEHLEHIATNVWKALSQNSDPKLQQTQPFIQIRRGTNVPYRARIGTSWREPGASVMWWSASNQHWTEAVFQEIHWSDLQMPVTVLNWMRLALWGLCIWAVPLFETSRFYRAGEAVNRKPAALTMWQRIRVRVELFLTSLLFALMLGTVGLAYLVLSRFMEARLIRRFYSLIYNYLGDVKLYQDYFPRTDPDLEVIGEKSRVAIRRRMVRAIVQMAKACKEGHLDGYFIVAHSLGTVVAYNALMDAEDILPNYLTYEEWSDKGLEEFKTKVPEQDACKSVQEPKRPPWLAPLDGLSRTTLFEHLEGVVTVGSPLNKFAALWPAIVPMHKNPVGNIPWVNVADAQDIVGAKLTLFGSSTSHHSMQSAFNVSGLQLTNLVWACAKWPFTAHTSYWHPGKGKNRLVNRMIDCLEGNAFSLAPMSSHSKIARYQMLRYVWIFVSAALALALLPEIFAIRAMLKVWPKDESMAFTAKVETLIKAMPDAHGHVLATMGWLLFWVILVVFIAGIIRRLWEQLYVTKWKNFTASRGRKPTFEEPLYDGTQWSRQ